MTPVKKSVELTGMVNIRNMWLIGTQLKHVQGDLGLHFLNDKTVATGLESDIMTVTLTVTCEVDLSYN